MAIKEYYIKIFSSDDMNAPATNESIFFCSRCVIVFYFLFVFILHGITKVLHILTTTYITIFIFRFSLLLNHIIYICKPQLLIFSVFIFHIFWTHLILDKPIQHNLFILRPQTSPQLNFSLLASQLFNFPKGESTSNYRSYLTLKKDMYLLK